MSSLKRVSIKSPHDYDSVAAEKLFIWLEQQKSSFGSKYKNYSPQRLDLKGHLCFDILVSESNEIVSGCGIYNGGRYPDGVYRILNRSFISPKFRSKSIFAAINTHQLLPVQLKENKTSLTTIFVSREGQKGRQMLTWWARKHAKAVFPDIAWSLPERLVNVTNNSLYKSDFQYIIRANFGESLWEPQAISKEKWQKLPN